MFWILKLFYLFQKSKIEMSKYLKNYNTNEINFSRIQHKHTCEEYLKCNYS